MAKSKSSTRAFRKEDIDEFDRKLRRFHESLAHKERRMLREIITASLEEEDSDVEGFASLSDEAVLELLRRVLLSRAEA